MRRIFHRFVLLYVVVAAWVLLHTLLLRHADERPDLHSLNYRPFLQWVCAVCGVMSAICYIQLQLNPATKASSQRGRLEYCEMCQESVHERSIHCPYCRQCILGLREHCIWTSGCIGVNNYKYLFLLLVYTSLGGAVFAFTTWRYVKGSAPDYLLGLGWKLVVYSHIAAVLGLWLNAVILLCTHTVLLINNMTMVDLRKGRLPPRGLCSWGAESGDYDLGSLANLRNALGSDVLYWCLPTAPNIAAVISEFPRVPS